jgi:hypothetical protein
MRGLPRERDASNLLTTSHIDMSYVSTIEMLCAKRVAAWRFIVLDNTIEEDASSPTHLMGKKN